MVKTIYEDDGRWIEIQSESLGDENNILSLSQGPGSEVVVGIHNIEPDTRASIIIRVDELLAALYLQGYIQSIPQIQYD